MSDYGLLAPVIAQLESWTVEDALQAFRQWRESGGELASSDNPLTQWLAWHSDLPWLQQQHEEGDPRAVLRAVEVCAVRGLPLPGWCRKQYLASWRQAKAAECRTLDEAFGYDTVMRGVSLDMARERNRSSVLLAVGVAQRVSQGSTVTAAIEQEASKHHVSYARAREWYYSLRQHPAVAAYLPAKAENPQKD